ncbi:hypothetical protein RESH_02977 [Rhodopirellula europaea SH398]|uniref:Uncharacterized protein n=1 Tax=Rhodopirellula europaea SH398 TaxID=1263868 RepID=M5SFK7_9BACT|nr:hypothetical protein RESH_02977 [Rhodopirellula europaea SH398]
MGSRLGPSPLLQQRVPEKGIHAKNQSMSCRVQLIWPASVELTRLPMN